MSSRVILHVRLTNAPGDETERVIVNRICQEVSKVTSGATEVLTVGYSYYHDHPLCPSHPDLKDKCL
jgi:hypothetical protein